MTPRAILVPPDGSPLAEAAIPMAVELAGERGAALLLLRAAEAPAWLNPTDAQVAVVREAKEYLEAAAAKLAQAGVKDVKTSVWYGAAAPAIVEAARVGHVDLIVMTTHGRSGLGRLMLGSVAESVLRGTSTPILLVRAPGAPLATPAGAAERTVPRA